MPDDKRLLWMKLYTFDIRNDSKLLMCSLLARAVAFLILTLMSESERRGYLLVNGKKPDEKELANQLHITRKECRKAIPELLEKGVFIEDALGVLCSPRMVRDHAKYLEASRHGREGGGNPALRVLPFDSRDTSKGTDKGTYKGTSKLRGERGEVRGEKDQYSRGSVPRARTSGPEVPKHIRPRVPPPIHDEFLQKLGDGKSPSDLITFYERITAEWKGRTIGDDDFTFWRARWREWLGTTTKRPTKATDRTAASIEALRSFAGGRS